MFAGSYDTGVYWYENGNNWNRTRIGTAGSIWSIDIGDLTNDNDLDVVVTSQDANTCYFQYNSTFNNWTQHTILNGFGKFRPRQIQ